MSKTFKSVIGKSDSRRVHIESRPEGPNLWLSDNSWGSDYGITLAPSDAPALALAILEAAGHTEDDRDDWDDRGLTHFAIAMINLRLGIAQQERATAEAEAQAKLEAEALELFNAGFPDCVEPPEIQRDMWLAVARKAREMRKP